MIPPADLRYEFELHQQGLHHIAGLDEAGRGAWAGPVAAGAVILPLDRFDLLHTLRGVNDSKQLSPAERENLLPRIMQTALAVGFGYASHTEIDQLGIVPATRLAMRRAVEALTVQPDALLTDAMSLPELHLPCVPLIRGDQKSLSIAAASIVAKVIRDQVMDQLDERYPQYGFLIHKGYGTDLHHKALKTYGPTEIHRATFAPIRALLHSSESSE
ncbi:MAG TPA: ribonuclease HII [Aggregatilineaceae bacterium]|nr:ribonuclease HII [Aggregatilineaceae bacterium]